MLKRKTSNIHQGQQRQKSFTYLTLVNEKLYAPILTNIIRTLSILIIYFLEDLQYFDDEMDDFAFHIVNFPHIYGHTPNKKNLTRYLSVLQVLTQRMSQIFLSKIL